MNKHFNNALMVLTALAGQVSRRMRGDKFFRLGTRANIDPQVLAEKFPSKEQREKHHARAGFIVINGKMVRRSKRGAKR